MVSEKNLVHKEGQLDARVCNELFSQPRFTHHVNLEPNKEVPLDPNRLECNVLFLILADLYLQHFVESYSHQHVYDKSRVYEAHFEH